MGTVHHTIIADKAGIIEHLNGQREQHQAMADHALTLRDKAHERGIVQGIELAIDVLEDWQLDEADELDESAWSQDHDSAELPARRAPVKRCEETIMRGTGGPGACDRPLDDHGYCDRVADHIS